jgi:hypothetical protein
MPSTSAHMVASLGPPYGSFWMVSYLYIIINARGLSTQRGRGGEGVPGRIPLGKKKEGHFHQLFVESLFLGDPPPDPRFLASLGEQSFFSLSVNGAPHIKDGILVFVRHVPVVSVWWNM